MALRALMVYYAIKPCSFLNNIHLMIDTKNQIYYSYLVPSVTIVTNSQDFATIKCLAPGKMIGMIPFYYLQRIDILCSYWTVPK